MEIFKIVVLTLSGLALIYASSMRLINPSKGNFVQTYVENPENVLANDADLLNEIRGIGAVLLLGGITLLLGALLPGFRQTALVIGGVLFVGVVAGRLTSFAVDGIPNVAIERATLIEIVLSVLNVVGLLMAFFGKE
ncbi:MAG TPA: hypothetical protein DCE41_34590 [Cytophagales bacterium]|nr:hypothetical protein [Cytophagales bacterium]HAA22955.1 hypothetical protein [Cytophagales bacterium]HAP60185.1 hypothetical protein [Cytophagales bacterium]